MTSSTQNKRKFLLLTSFTLPETAGSGINAYRFARFINNQIDKATLLTFNRNCKLLSKEIIENVPIHRIPYFNKGLIMKIISLPIVIYYYLLFVWRNDIIFIYGGRVFAWELAIFISKLFQKKIVFQSLLEGIDDINSLIINRSKFYSKIYKVLLKDIQCYYSINQNFTQQYITIYGEKSSILTLPQGVNEGEFHQILDEKKKQLREELSLPIHTQLIISIGFLLPRKGYIEIFEQLQKLEYDYKYLVLGEYNPSNNHFLSGYKKEMMEIYLKGRRILKDRVSFLGFCNNSVQYLQCSDFFLMNSVQEGFPNAMLEAMSCGIPVVTRSLKGVTNFFIKHMYNSLVYNSSEEIPLLLNHLYHNPEERKRIVQTARLDVEEKFSFTKIYPRLLEKLEK